MIELLVTCWVAAATTFVVPEGWVVRDVRSPGDPCAWVCGPNTCLSVVCTSPPQTDRIWTQTRITLAKTMSVGASVTAPEKCTLDTIQGGTKP